MGFSEFWLQSNNGKEMSLQNLKELKRSDLKGNSELIKLFDFFNTNKLNGSEEVLDKEELTSLFNTMQKTAQSSKGKDTSIFETEEAEEFISTTQTSEGKTLKELGVKATDMFEFLSKLVKTQNAPHPLDTTIINLTEEQAQEEVISVLSNDAAEARTLLMQQDNGVVSDLYNKYKEWRDDDLSLSNIEEAVVLQQEGADNLYKAKEGELSKREYFLQNREHLKTMMKRRLFRKDENTGLDFLDRNRGKMTKEQFAKMMEDYINEQIDKIDKLDSLKNIQHKLFVTTNAGVEQMLKNYKKGAEEELLHNPVAEQRLIKIKTPKIPVEYDTTEPMTFEEVFKFERNQEYSKGNVENYLRQKQRIDFATGAYNKYQSFKIASDEFLDNYKKSTNVYSDMDGNSFGGKEPNPNEQMNKVIELFTAYYDNPFKPNLAKEELEHLISENNLPISVIFTPDGSISLDLSKISNDNQKNRVLNQLVKLETGKLKKDLETTLGGDIEEKLTSFASKTQSAYTSAYGQDFTQELAQEMADDNKTFIQKYTGNTSMVGMGLTVVGGILCFTPAAPLGAGMVTVGNTLAIGGMVAESSLGYTEALTRSSLDEEEIKELSKTLVMNAGGFVVGFQAGKTGMKAFNKLIDKKLAEVFKTEMVKGNRTEALKQVFTNPEHLKNFMQAAGVKLSADFIISYAGDLAMMGVLDTQDDWQSLLQANLIGIMAGMGGDIKEAARLGMKGDRYRTLRQKEGVNGLTAEEAKELATLRNDPDIKRQPSLSEIDKIARAEDINQANLSPHRFNDVKGKRAQAQVSHYLDYLLESIPSDVKEAPIDAIKKSDDFILPDGTVISRNYAGDNGKFVYDEKTKTHVVQDVDNAVLFWIKDTNGQEHVLPCLTPENVTKARKLIGYLATQEAVPRDNIDVVQKQVLESNKAQTEADVTHAKPHNGKAVKVLLAENGEGFIVKIGEEEFTAKDFDEVKNIIDTKAKDADNIDFSALELKEDICASTDESSSIESTTPESKEQILANAVKNCGEPEVSKLIGRTKEVYRDSNGNEIAVVLKNSDGSIYSMKVAEYDPQNPTGRPKISNYGEETKGIDISKASAKDIKEFSDFLDKQNIESSDKEALMICFKRHPDGVKALLKESRSLDVDEFTDLARCMESNPEECSRLLNLKYDEVGDDYMLYADQIPALVEAEAKFPGIVEKITRDAGMRSRSGSRQVSIIPDIAEAYAKNPGLVRDINRRIENGYASIPIEGLAKASINNPRGVQFFILDPDFARYTTYLKGKASPEVWEKIVKYHEEDHALFNKFANRSGVKIEDVPNLMDANRINPNLTESLLGQDNWNSAQILDLVKTEQTLPQKQKTPERHTDTKTVKEEPVQQEDIPAKTQISSTEMETILKDAIKDCGEPKVEDYFLEKKYTYTDKNGNVVAVVLKGLDGEISGMEIAKYHAERPDVRVYGDTSDISGEPLIQRAGKKEITELEELFKKRLDKLVNSYSAEDRAILNEYLKLSEGKEREKYLDNLRYRDANDAIRHQYSVIARYERTKIGHEYYIEACKRHPEGVEALQEFAKQEEISLSYFDYRVLAATMETNPNECKRLLKIKDRAPVQHEYNTGRGLYRTTINHDFALHPETIINVIETEAKFPGVIEKIVKDGFLDAERGELSASRLNAIAEAYSKDPTLVRFIYTEEGCSNIPRERLCQASVEEHDAVVKFVHEDGLYVNKYTSDYRFYDNTSDTLNDSMHYYGKDSKLFNDIRNDKIENSTGYRVNRWYVEDIPKIMKAREINPSITDILRKSSKVNYANDILDFANATKDCPRGAQLLLESKFDLDLYKIEELAPDIEANYDRAVELLKKQPNITWEQFVVILL